MPTTWPEPLPDATYLLLTTFRKDGRAVPTPVWFAAEPTPGRPPALLVFSGRGAGKSKRLRHTSRVLVSACTARGKPLGDDVEAHAELYEDQRAWSVRAQVGRRHGVSYRLWALYFRLFNREEYQNPVGIRITLPPT